MNRLSIKESTRSFISESWTLSWPMTLIMFFEFLIGLSDVYIAGRFGNDVQAAYGLAFQMYFVFILIGLALSTGTVSVISRLFACDDKREFRVGAGSSLVLSALAGTIFSAMGFLFAGKIFGIYDIPDNIKYMAARLLRIYSIGFLFDYILLSINSIMRSSGMIRNSLLVMVVAGILNIVLNFILAFGTPLGFTGIAVATVISLFAGSVLAAGYARSIIGKISGISYGIIKQIVIISWPSGVLQIVWQIGSAALFLILSGLPDHNVEIIAAFTNGMKIESAIFLPAFAFSMANAVIVGNLLGKKTGDRAFRGGLVTAFLGVAIISVITLVIMLNARAIASSLSSDPLVVSECVKYIYIALLSEPVMAWAVILGGGLNGAGDTLGVMIIVALSVWIVRIPLGYLFGLYYGFGASAVWWSMNVSILAHAIFVTKRYFARKWAVA